MGWGCLDLYNNFDPPLFIEVSVQSQESKWSCIYLLGVLIMPLFLQIVFHLILELFGWYGMFCFSFYFSEHRFVENS